MVERDLISLYLSDIRKYNILTKDEEQELLKKVKKGDKDAKNKLILSNLRLVVNIAKSYNKKGMSLIDMISEGNFGLIYAIDKFDENRGNRFSTYAVWWIKQSISKALITKGREIRIPSYKYDILNKINRVIMEKMMRNGLYPKIEEIAQELDMSIEKIEEIMVEFQDILSMNATIGENLYLEDTISLDEDYTLEDKVLDEITRKKLLEVINSLGMRESDILKRRYGLEGYETQTLEEIGKNFKITRERVRQIEQKTLEKLKNKYGVGGKKNY